LPFETPSVTIRADVPTPTATQNLTATLTPRKESATPIPITPTPEISCGDLTGQVIQENLDHPSLPRSLPFRIYLPPCYDQFKGQGFPVVYLLHGLYLNDSQWDDLGADEIATQLILNGVVPPFLMVMPWERTGLDMVFAISEVLIPHIEEQYHAIDDREFRAIGGISRGGGWAFRIAMTKPETFGAVGMHSPAILPPDQFFLHRWLDGIEVNDLPALWMDIGERDTLRFEVYEFMDQLDQLGVPYTWSSDRGEHTTEYWENHIELYLRWYADHWIQARLSPKFN
jgi:enterochelin esterase-like enzyme